MNKYFGKRVYEGIAIGKLYKYDNNITVTKEIGQGYDVEINRFNEARQKAIDEYKFVHYNANKLMDKKNSDIIISLIMLLEDLDFIEGVENQLKNEKITAEYAVYLTMKQLQKILSDLDNDYLKERIKDINDISFKVIYYLKGEQQQLNIDQPLIILADNMNASELIKIEKEKILGIVFQNVSINSHIAILARSLAIPTIASIEEEIIYNDGDIVIVDGNHGILITSPTPKYLEEYSYLQSEYNKNKLSLDKYKNKKPYTKDGKTIEVFSNIASTYEIDFVLENNSDGIGLFRSEYIYMDSNTFPSEQSQFNHYKKVIQEMNDKITIIRTMDLGVDKTPSYIKMPKEINPALGYRAIRMYRDYKNEFKQQIRALYRASIYGNLYIMIPMVNTVQDIQYIKSVCEEAKEELRNDNIDFKKDVKIGIMIETPAACIICDELIKEVDFISIGTNDLSQYVLAMDRENNNISNYFDPHHKAILRLIYYVVKVAKKQNKMVGICGELARDKELLPFYLLIEVDEISVSSSYVLQVKKNIEDIDLSKYNLNMYI